MLDSIRVCIDRTIHYTSEHGFLSTNLFDGRISIQQVVEADIIFAFRESELYSITRYSNGKWPVLYTARSFETAIREIAYHLRKGWIADKDTLITKKYRTVNKIAYVVKLISKKVKVLKSDLRVLDPIDYSYCHLIAEQARDDGFEIIDAPSARHKDGRCYPVLFKHALETNSVLAEKFNIRWYSKTDELFHHADRKATLIDFWQK